MARIVSSLQDINVSIDRDLGSKYDHVWTVAKNITNVVKLAENIPATLKYLGPATTPPTTRLDGSPVLDGDYYLDQDISALVYFNATSNDWVVVDLNYMVTSAQSSADAAAASEIAAASSESTATTKAAEAETSASEALASKEAAETASSASEQSATDSEASKVLAEGYASSASTSADTATNSMNAASTHEADALAHKNSAETAATNASNSEISADNSATSAAASEANVVSLFDDFDDRFLGTFATPPTMDNDGDPLSVGACYYDSAKLEIAFWNGTSWDAPSTSANNAAQSEANAENSATAAQTSENNAATSEANAADSAEAAATDAATATTAKNDAQTAATNASNSETNAGTHASNAATSESNALTYKSAAETAKGLAETYRDEAVTAKTAAETAETNATNSAGTADSHRIAAETARTGAETAEANVITLEASAVNASSISAANANYKGEWASLEGPLNIPASVKDGTGVYMLNEDIPDVAASQPSVDTANWFLLGVIGQSAAPDALRLGGELPEYYTNPDNLPDTSSVNKWVTQADKDKLAAIEANATADQTAAEIKSLYESVANAYSNTEKTKLAGIEEAATADQTAAEIKSLYESVANPYSDADLAKLAAIESGATADQTAAEIKSLYESVANPFTDAEQTLVANAIQNTEKGTANGVAMLDGSGLVPSSQLPSYVDDVVEYADFASLPATGEGGKIYIALDTGATYRWGGSSYIQTNSDLSAAEIKSLYEANADTNAFTDTEQTKLAGIESGATADMTAAEIKTVYESNSDTNAFTTEEKNKLANIYTDIDRNKIFSLAGMVL
jgi:hypothetical protein